VIGRKNELFGDLPKGAKAGAALYRLIETAKTNRLKPMLISTVLLKSGPQHKA
jgi:hypothetical protein